MGAQKKFIETTSGPTPEMVAAGVAELREKMFGMDMAEIVTDVFYAMIAEAAPIEQAPPLPPAGV